MVTSFFFYFFLFILSLLPLCVFYQSAKKSRAIYSVLRLCISLVVRVTGIFFVGCCTSEYLYRHFATPIRDTYPFVCTWKHFSCTFPVEWPVVSSHVEQNRPWLVMLCFMQGNFVSKYDDDDSKKQKRALKKR